MLRSFKKFWVLVLLASSIIWAGAFTLLGPYENYQVPAIGYNLAGDPGGPMNLGEEYRWTIPVITYGFDQSFLNYFGSNGVRAVEQAFAILNGTNIFQNYTNLTPLTGPYSAMSSDLAEFPQNSQRVHLQASALGLIDLKSSTLSVLMEQLGLASPERFTWTLRSRLTGTGFTNYVVIQRNFDPATFEPSSYVNGTLYTYRIFDPLSAFDGTGALINYSDAVEFPADPDAFVNTAVATGGLLTGGYYTGLTRDDVGGLRYLYRKENLNMENLLSDTQLAVTSNVPTLITNFDLGLFISRSANGTTNSPTQLLSLYPGLIINSVNTRLTNMVVTNIFNYFTNFPVGPPTRVSVTNFTTRYVTVFDYTFGNLKTNSYYTNGFVIDETITVTNNDSFVPGLGGVVTNVAIIGPYLTNSINGDFYILPNNMPDFFITSTQSLLVVMTTNIISSDFGNLFAFTNRTQMVAIFTQDLGLLSQRSYGTTNLYTDITNFYPGILITRTNSRLTNITYVNFVGNKAYVSNRLTRVFDYSYGNVVTNFLSKNSIVTRQIVEIAPAGPGQAPGSPLIVTNVISSSTVTNFGVLSGAFFIVPTNLLGYVNALNETDSAFNTDWLFFETNSVTSVVYTNLTNATAVFTNRAAPFSLTNTDLRLFTERARTNTTANFLALYPGVLISSTNSTFALNVTPVVTTYLTNFPWSPLGVLTLASNVTFLTNVIQVFDYTFANVVTNNYFGNTVTNAGYTNGFVTTQGFTVTQDPFGAFGGLGRINYFSSTTVSNFLNGNVYIVPPNLFGYDIVATQLVALSFTTNVIFSSTVTNNSLVVTNARTEQVFYSTNYFFTAYPIEFLNPTNVGLTGFGRRIEDVRIVTNYVFAAYEILLLNRPVGLGPGVGTLHELITFSTNTVLSGFQIGFTNGNNLSLSPSLRPGVDKITFQRVNFDSLLGQTFTPVTNIFPQYILTNSLVVTQYLRRIINQPDILFLASDLGQLSYARTIATSWTNNNAINGQSALAGPGVIPPGRRITFNKVGATYRNFAGTPFLDETTATRSFIWGSFDGSTNAPVIYPSGTSIQDLERQVLTGP